VDLFGTVSRWALSDVHRLEPDEQPDLRDLVAGTSRPLTNNTTYGSLVFRLVAISKNGEKSPMSGRRPEILTNCISPAARIGRPTLRIGCVNSKRANRFARSTGRQNGKWIAVLIERVDKSSLIALNLGRRRHGAAAEILLTARRQQDGVFPDGRFIAYDLSVIEPRPQAQVLVMAVDGSREESSSMIQARTT
jgi:hypothetical protein